MRAESPKSSIAQGNALGIRYLPTMRPVRATLIFHCFYSCPYRARCRLCIRLPRALPWAMKVIGLSARFVLLLPNPPIESSSYIKINMTTYLIMKTVVVGSLITILCLNSCLYRKFVLILQHNSTIVGIY